MEGGGCGRIVVAVVLLLVSVVVPCSTYSELASASAAASWMGRPQCSPTSSVLNHFASETWGVSSVRMTSICKVSANTKLPVL